MADIIDLTRRTMEAFEGVPKVTDKEAESWALTAVERHGYEKPEDVPTDEIYLVLILAQAQGARQISLRTAHYFEYQDSDERVNQSEVSDKYYRISQALYADYNTEVIRSGSRASRYKQGKRLDRSRPNRMRRPF